MTNEIEATESKDLVFEQDGDICTNSVIVSDRFEKEHCDVLKAIRNIIEADSEDGISLGNFAESNYISRGKEYPMYVMNEEGFMELVMGFTGSKARKTRKVFIKRFMEMRNRLQAPKTSMQLWEETPELLMIETLTKLHNEKMSHKETKTLLQLEKTAHDELRDDLEFLQPHLTQVALNLQTPGSMLINEFANYLNQSLPKDKQFKAEILRSLLIKFNWLGSKRTYVMGREVNEYSVRAAHINKFDSIKQGAGKPWEKFTIYINYNGQVAFVEKLLKSDYIKAEVRKELVNGIKISCAGFSMYKETSREVKKLEKGE